MMPSHMMDQRHLSSLLMRSAPSSLFSEESCLPSERQLGFRKAESMPENSGLEEMSLMPGGKSFSSPALEKLHPMGGNNLNLLESPRTFLSMGQRARTSAGNNLFSSESPSNLSVACLGASNQEILSQANAFMQPVRNGFHYENSLFSSSLSETFGKSVLLSSDTHFGKSVDVNDSKFVEDDEPMESLKEIEAQTIGDLLPNDDDLLSGVIDDMECVAQANSGDEDDLFCSGGGIELESEESFNCNRASDFVRGVASSCQLGGLNGTYTGELIYGKQTSRTLLVRNIKSNVEDAELKIFFEQFGDIGRLHTVGKDQGFVLVSYYDIRSARDAMRAIQLLRQHKIDLSYYFPKDNSSEQDINNDTLIIFNLDSAVSNDDIHRIFGAYGEIKEIFHDPRNQNQRALEFYDVRAAEAAFYALNMSEIAGKRIKIEPGCLGPGWRRLGKHSSLELELEGGSPSNSLLEIGASSRTKAYGANTSVGFDSGSIQSSALQTLISPFMESKFPGISSTVPRSVSSPIRVTMVGNHGSQSNLDDLSHSLGQMNFGFQSMPTFHPHSLPEFHNGPISSIPFNTLRTIPSMGTNINSRISDGIDAQQNRQGAGLLNSHSFEHNEGKAISPINGHHQYIPNNSNINFHHSPGSLVWQNSPSYVNNIPAPHQQLHGLPRGPSHIMNNFVPLHHHHVGSAPALNPSLWGRRGTYAGDCIESPSFHAGSLGTMGFSGSPQMHSFGISSHNIYPHDCRNCIDHPSASALVGSPTPQQRSPMLHGRNSLNSAAASYDSSGERIRSRRCDSTATTQPDNKKQFDLEIGRIIRGEDSRTTLMIKNIPNKYTSKMLLATIDEHHKGTYDFIYLPIDFKNKCNVGYAFINLNDPKHIIPFHQAFNGKKWEKFNSEKVASLAYARIQGKAALIAHFQNSSLMNEDKRCRPILFHSDGPNAGDQEPFPMGTHIRSRAGRSRSTNNEEQNPRSPPDSGNGDDQSNNSTDSSSSSFTKD